MKSVRLVAALAAVLALVVVAAGCGGSHHVAAPKPPAHHYALKAEWYIRGAFTQGAYPLRAVVCKPLGGARVSCTVEVGGFFQHALACSTAVYTVSAEKLTGGSFPYPKPCKVKPAS